MPLVTQGAEQQRYVIDDERSWIRVLVYRGGLLSGFGHNHVIASFDITGSVIRGNEVGDTVVSISFPARSLLVDNSDLRVLEGEDFSASISDNDKNATRQNLLGERVLDDENHPLVHVRSTAVAGNLDSLLVSAEVTVAGTTNSISFPASAFLSDEIVTVSGLATIRHKDIGLKPFSAAFGTLKVRQELTVRFEIVAVIE